jgi:hypothetical protein
LICQNEALDGIRVWDSFRKKLESEENILREDFVREVMVLSGNRLSLKIWFLLQQYSGNPYAEAVSGPERELLKPILSALEQRDTELAIQSFKSWSGWIQKRRMQNGDDS